MKAKMLSLITMMFKMQHFFFSSPSLQPRNFSLHLLLNEDQAVLRALSLHMISCVASDGYHFYIKGYSLYPVQTLKPLSEDIT